MFETGTFPNQSPKLMMLIENRMTSCARSTVSGSKKFCFLSFRTFKLTIMPDLMLTALSTSIHVRFISYPSSTKHISELWIHHLLFKTLKYLYTATLLSYHHTTTSLFINLTHFCLQRISAHESASTFRDKQDTDTEAQI